MINTIAKASIVLLFASCLPAFAMQTKAEDQQQVELAQLLLQLSGLSSHAAALPELAESTLEQAMVDMPRNDRKQITKALREAFVADEFQSVLLAALLDKYDGMKVSTLIARYRMSSVQDVVQAAQKSLGSDRSSRAVWQATMGEATSTNEKRALIEKIVDTGFQKPINQIMRRTLSSSLLHAKASLRSEGNGEVHQAQTDAEQHRYEFAKAQNSEVELKQAIHGFRSVSASQLRAYLLRTNGEYATWLNQLAAAALGDALLDSVRKMQLLIEQSQQKNLQQNTYSRLDNS